MVLLDLEIKLVSEKVNPNMKLSIPLDQGQSNSLLILKVCTNFLHGAQHRFSLLIEPSI